MTAVSVAQAGTYDGDLQSLESIEQAAERHVIEMVDGTDHGINASAGTLDRRLRLSRCTAPLETFSPPGRTSGARRTVGVRCQDDNPWSLYVPVTLSIMKEVAVVSRALSRGHVLSAQDITFDLRDVAPLHQGYYTRKQSIIGHKLKRNLKGGEILTARQLTAPQTVKRGDKVVIVARSETVQIHMTGKAMENGTLGERIKVTNSSSGKEIEAIIVESGVVEVSF